MSNQPSFHEDFNLPEDLVDSARQVTSFATHFIDLNGAKSFQWQKFLDEGVNKIKINADNGPGTGSDLAMDKFQSDVIRQQNGTAPAMVDKIVAFLGAFDVTVDDDVRAVLLKNIEKTLANPNAASHPSDVSQSGSSRILWQYRLHSAIRNPDLPTFFYSVLITIEVEANYSWWGSRDGAQGEFSANIDGMRLIVQKGFKDPHN
ncbi:hypothetical protein VNI00_006492 [Paramarasmius palmivorus]|uniref:Uncharacterized protein n=1 Tax=Paramarasmius palmivorus TaxID=297713 RepID=A0AAW0D9V4_9AGAR